MKITSFLSLIEQFSSEQRKELVDLSELVSQLYSIYGDNLAQNTLISEINKIYPDAGSYIELISTTIWLNHCSELCRELNVTNDSILCSYHSNDLSLLDHLSKIQQWPISTNWNDEIGVKIQSTSGKSYERTLEKDIQNLVR